MGRQFNPDSWLHLQMVAKEKVRKQTSLKTKNAKDAQRLGNTKNEACQQQAMNLQI